MSQLLLNQFQFTQDVAALIEFIYSKGYLCTLGEVYRTKEQAEWYAKKGLGIRDSLHCKRLAVDINLFDRNEVLCTDGKHFTEFGAYWQSLHADNRWGGTFARADYGHFERQDL